MLLLVARAFACARAFATSVQVLLRSCFCFARAFASLVVMNAASNAFSVLSHLSVV